MSCWPSRTAAKGAGEVERLVAADHPDRYLVGPRTPGPYFLRREAGALVVYDEAARELARFAKNGDAAAFLKIANLTFGTLTLPAPLFGESR